MKVLNISKKYLLVAAASALVLTATVGSTMAYFTTFAEAKGKIAISLGKTSTEIEEKLSGLDKYISVKNLDTSDDDVFVRVKVIYSNSQANVLITGENNGWQSNADGWYYYYKAVAPGESTGTLVAEVKKLKDNEDKDFQIVVVHESIPARGEANWSDAMAAQDSLADLNNGGES